MLVDRGGLNSRERKCVCRVVMGIYLLISRNYELIIVTVVLLFNTTVFGKTIKCGAKYSKI